MVKYTEQIRNYNNSNYTHKRSIKTDNMHKNKRKTS